MSLSLSQYQSIMRAYDARRAEAHRIQQEHLDRVRTMIPEFSELEDEAAEIALDYAKKMLYTPDISLKEMDVALSAITAKKHSLLRQHNLDSAYIEPPYICPDCKDTGYIDNQKCHCFKQAEIKILYNQSNIHEFFKTKNFEHLREDIYEGEDLERFRRALSISKAYVHNFDTAPHNLMFFGTVGTGKSFLSGCIAYELLLSGHSVIYFSSSDLFSMLSDEAFHRNSAVSKDKNGNDIYECDLLIIDDLGTEIGSQFVNSSLFTCLNERQLRHKSTIISTNLLLSELQERYSDRVFSRISGSFEIIKLTGPDLRIAQKDKVN